MEECGWHWLGPVLPKELSLKLEWYFLSARSNEFHLPRVYPGESFVICHLSFVTWNLELGTWNLELGTWNLEPET